MTANEIVRQWRKTSTLTLNGLAQRSRLSVPFLSDIEHGRRQVSLRAARAIAEGLEQPVAEILAAVLQERLEAAGVYLRVSLREPGGTEEW